MNMTRRLGQGRGKGNRRWLLRRVTATAILAGVAALAGCGAGRDVLVLPSPTPPDDPVVSIRAYFAAQEQGDAARAWALMGPDWQRQYPADQRQQLLSHPQPVHFLSAQETPNSLAQAPAARALRREYLATLDVQGTNLGPWNPGRNGRFVGVVWGHDGWLVDAVASSPGYLSCGGNACGTPAGTATPRST